MPLGKHLCRISLFHGKEGCVGDKSLVGHVLLLGGCTHSITGKLARINSWRSPAQLALEPGLWPTLEQVSHSFALPHLKTREGSEHTASLGVPSHLPRAAGVS